MVCRGGNWIRRGKETKPRIGPFAGSSLSENRQVGLGPWRNVEERDPGFLPSCVIVSR